MKKYFKDIKKPKWYLALAAVVVFAIQCTAVINLGFGMGWNYYAIIPVQVAAGYLNVLMFLMVQKDMKQKHFWAFAAISIVAGAAIGIAFIEGLYTTVAGAKGVLYGVTAQLTLASAVYALISAIKSMIAGRKAEPDDVNSEHKEAHAHRLKLVFPDESHEKEYFAMMDEWTAFGGRLNPGALRNKGNKYSKWLSWVKDDEDVSKIKDGRAAQTLFFLMKEGEERIYGAVSIRHSLNEGLLKTGGHIGYGIRPSERKKGYATAMLALALRKCRELGIMRVLVTCDKDNIDSAKVIQNNGGVLENEVLNEKGMPVQRYWIDIR